jgi:hypothetical protein
MGKDRMESREFGAESGKRKVCREVVLFDSALIVIRLRQIFPVQQSPSFSALTSEQSEMRKKICRWRIANTKKQKALTDFLLFCIRSETTFLSAV